MDSIYLLIGDQDSRTRSRAIHALCRYVEPENGQNCNRNVAIGNFVCTRIFNMLPLSFGDFKIERFQRRHVKLGKVLYTLSNKLMELDDRNQQFGIISAIAELVKIFNPIKYHSVWNEFNIFETCLTFMRENYVIGTDATCQSDMINICTSLIAGNTIIVVCMGEFNVFEQNFRKCFRLEVHLVERNKHIAPACFKIIEHISSCIQRHSTDIHSEGSKKRHFY